MSAAGLVAAGLAWPSITLAPRDSRTRAAAAAVLEQAAVAEQNWSLAHHRYAPVRADLSSPQDTALLQVALAPEQAADFLLDALPRPDGSLRLRVVSRPDAIRDGRVTPLLLSRTLPSVTPRPDAGAAAGERAREGSR